tara:strand:- start:1469 stop:1864 length:396 start_codon:yes stop_codon:yes gene_type:complete
MALVPTLTITDTTTFSDDISFSVTDSLGVTAPAQSLSTIIATDTGENNIIITDTGGAIVWLFVRHTGTTDGSAATVRQVDVEFTTHEGIARLSTGEWLFMPVSHAGASVGVQLQVNHASNVQMEYAYWTAA